MAEQADSASRAWTVAAIGAVMAILSYLALIRTVPGQRLDDLAFHGRKAMYFPIRRALSVVMRWCTVPATAVGVGTLALRALKRGRWGLGLGAAAAVGSSAALAKVVKELAARPRLVDFPYSTAANTFPSGHTSGVVALCLCWIWITGRLELRSRPTVVAAIAVAWTTLMVGSGWHRPSDVMGGVGLGLFASATMSAVVGVLPARGRLGLRCDQGPRNTWYSGLIRSCAIWVLVALGFVVTTWAVNPRRRESLPAYLLAVGICGMLVVGAIVLTCWETDSTRSTPGGARSHRRND